MALNISQLKQLKKLFSLFSKKEKRKILFLNIIFIINSFVEAVGMSILPAFLFGIVKFDDLQANPKYNEILLFFGVESQMGFVITGSIAVLIIVLLKNSFTYLTLYLKSKFFKALQVRLSNRLFTLYMNAPYIFHISRNTAELMRNAKSESKLIITSVLSSVLKVVMDITLIISVFVLLVLVDPLITIIAFAFLGTVVFLFMNYSKKKTDYYGKMILQEKKQSIKAVNQALGGIKEVKVLGRENFFIKKFLHTSINGAKATEFKELLTGSTKPVLEIFAVAFILIILIISSLQYSSISEVIPTIILFGVATMRILPSFRDFTNSLTTLKYSIHSIEPVYKDINLLKNVEKEQADKSDDKNVNFKFRKSIRVKDLSFKYPGTDKLVLKNIDFEIKFGELIGIVGVSGSGKTTLVDLLLGILSPDKGDILVDDVNIRDNIKAWQSHIGYIPQNIFLVDGSFKNNIAMGLGADNIDEEMLNMAIRSAQLEDLVKSLPNGIKTKTGERGVKISGGQRQRIGIARAIYNNPELLIMDEATSALDNITEKEIINSLNLMKGSRTVIMIAHRLTTIMNCDKIYFMQDGEITRVGTYNELYDSHSEFRKLALAANN